MSTTVLSAILFDILIIKRAGLCSRVIAGRSVMVTSQREGNMIVNEVNGGTEHRFGSLTMEE